MNEPEYRYRGARAMVLLHDYHLRECIEVWKKARLHGILLPETSDPDYKSRQTLMRHVLRASRGYLIWICEKLELDDPRIQPAPDADKIDDEVDSYTEHLLSRWKHPLAVVEEGKFYHPEYVSRWGVVYCIDTMLEHAVMHPIRHSFQLRELGGKMFHR